MSHSRPAAPGHAKAAFQALFVTFLWSTSWVLIKLGLGEIPALTFAGLRYGLAFLVLLPLALRPAVRTELARLTRRDLWRLARLGVVMYGLTQGAQFLALAYLPAQTTSLLLSFSPVLVALLSALLLGEHPHPRQWSGVALYLVGAGLFLYPAGLAGARALGFVVALVGLFSNALAALLGRALGREARLSPLAVTFVSMGVGAAALLVSGLAVQGLPSLSARSWLIVLWLALVNTAFAFTLWNLTLRRLSAVESSVINNTMLIQIALLAWLFLGESLGVRELLGLLLAALGTLVVQLARRPSS